MAQKAKKRRVNEDLSNFILISLLKEGPLTFKEIEANTALQTMDLGDGRRGKRGEKPDKTANVCGELVRRQLLHLTDEGKYELTQQGRSKAAEKQWEMEKGANIVEHQLLSPSATARNSTVAYLFLSVVKLLAGFFSGSVGLVADGADTTVDTAASAIVWGGIKFKREILGTVTIIALMFITAVILCYDSVKAVVMNVEGTFLPMAHPIIVIAVELIAVVSMFAVSLYQRFVGRRSQSLSLISQSVDSKNSVYSSAAVIVGALFSIFGVHWVDAVVGGFIAARIILDGVDLTRQAAAAMRGQAPNLSQFKLPFEQQIRERRMGNFRNWVLYCIQEEKGKACTRQMIVSSLEKTFRPSYLPLVFAEFTVGKEFDFDQNFPDIVSPLVADALLHETESGYALTDKGKAYLKGAINTLRYRETEL